MNLLSFLFFLTTVLRSKFKTLVLVILVSITTITLGSTLFFPQLQLLYSNSLNNVQMLTILFATTGALALIHGLLQLNTKQFIFSALYAASSLQIVGSTNFGSMLFYTEIASLAALGLIFSNKNTNTLEAGLRYAANHFFWGVLISAATSSYFFLPLELTNLSLFQQNLLLLGFLINIGCFPFSAWLPDTYTSASPSATVTLQLFYSKALLFLLNNLFAGNNYLIYLGIITALYGALYCLLENNLRKFLIYNNVGQNGFLIAAIGMEADIVPYMVASATYQTLLAIIVSNISKVTVNFIDLKKYNLKNKILLISSMAAVLSMGTLPFTQIFFSKLILLRTISIPSFSTGLSLISLTLFFCCGLRFFYNLFIYSSSLKKPIVISRSEQLILTSNSLFCFLPLIYVSSSVITIFEYFITLGGAIIFFTFFRKKLTPKKRTLVDIDWLYRVFLLDLLRLGKKFFSFTENFFIDIVNSKYKSIVNFSGFSHTENVSRTIFISIVIVMVVLIINLYV